MGKKDYKDLENLLTEIKQSYKGKNQTWKNVAKRLNVSYSTIYRWRKKGVKKEERIKQVRKKAVGRKIRITAFDRTDNFLNKIGNIDQSGYDYLIVYMKFDAYKAGEFLQHVNTSKIVYPEQNIEEFINEYMEIFKEIGEESDVYYYLVNYNIRGVKVGKEENEKNVVNYIG